jgi:hypothetical protein
MKRRWSVCAQLKLGFQWKVKRGIRPGFRFWNKKGGKSGGGGRDGQITDGLSFVVQTQTRLPMTPAVCRRSSQKEGGTRGLSLLPLIFLSSNFCPSVCPVTHHKLSYDPRLITAKNPQRRCSRYYGQTSPPPTHLGSALAISLVPSIDGAGLLVGNGPVVSPGRRF